MLEDPDASVKDAAFGYWDPRGVSMRTDRYRLSRYQPDGSEPVYELYDLQEDPYETRNIAEEQPEVVQRLAEQMAAAEADAQAASQ